MPVGGPRARLVERSLALVVVASVVLPAAAGRSSAAADDTRTPVLHEYVAPPSPGEGRLIGARRPDGDGEPSRPPPRDANPTAFRQRDRILVEPPLTPAPAPGEPIHGAEDTDERTPVIRPDYVTSVDGTLRYAEVYEPSIVPYKRLAAMDGLGAGWTLRSHDPTRTILPIGGRPLPDRELFWGSLLVDLPPGRDVAIPSAAPEMRILSYETDPATALIFARDGAGNHFVRAAGSPPSGPVRIVFLVDAPASYFGARTPPAIRLADLAAQTPPRPLPPYARASAGTLLRRLRIGPQTRLDDALRRLVEYFRGFAPGAPPAPSGDPYLDLALSRRGVCRHRAFAFTVTANAAGIATRYVTNEAHAFVEVLLPRQGWVRIDLGGAAVQLDVANADRKAMHRPRRRDPFPRPPGFARSYSRLGGAVHGLSRQQVAEATAGEDEPPRAQRRERAAGARDPGGRLPRPTAATRAGRRALVVRVEAAGDAVFRGETVRVSGRVRPAAGGDGPAGLKLDLYLAPADARGDGARLVGQTVTGAGGGFSATVELPADLEPGPHEVYAATEGDARWAPATSD